MMTAEPARVASHARPNASTIATIVGVPGRSICSAEPSNQRRHDVACRSSSVADQESRTRRRSFARRRARDRLALRQPDDDRQDDQPDDVVDHRRARE